MLNKINLVLLLIFILSFVTVVSAASPFVSTQGVTLNIESPPFSYVSLHSEHRFHAHVINSTNTKTNRSTSCYLHVYNQTGYDINNGSTNMEFETYNGIDFAKTISGGNFSSLGEYAFVIQCNSTNEIGFFVNSFEVTKSGIGKITIGESLVYYSILLPMIIIFITLLFFGLNARMTGIKVSLIVFALIDLFIIVLFILNASNEILFNYHVMQANYETFYFIMVTGLIISVGIGIVGLLILVYISWFIKRGLRG